jgi:predicted deacylase
VLVPLVNVASFEQITPHVNPVDAKNMNRFYPGTMGGTQTDRASYAVTKEVVEKCDHLIDLHGGDLDENLRPYSYWTVTGNTKQDEVSKAMVLAFGLDHIIVSRDRPKDPNASRYLENTATTRGKPSFTAEAGRSGPVDMADTSLLTAGVEHVMQYLKMLPAPPSGVPVVQHPVWVETLATMTADAGGVFFPSARPGARVVKGQKIGTVTDYLHQHARDIAATETGMIMFIRALPSLRKGDTIATIGVVAP